MNDDFIFLDLFGDIDEQFIHLAGQPWKKKSSFIWINCIGARVACIILIVLLGLSCVFRAEVKAAWEKFTTKISQFLGIESDLSPYTEVKDSSITKNGETLTLKEVILDKDELVILIISDNKADDFELSSKVLIDGQEIRNQKSLMTDDLLRPPHKFILSYRFSDEIAVNQDMVNVRLEITTKSRNNKNGEKYVFEFTASKAELQKNTISKSLEQNVNLGESCTMKLSKFTMNSIESGIIGNCDNLPGGVEYSLKGKDNLGNHVTYRLMTYENPHAVFVKEDKCKISPQAVSLELQMYKHTNGKVFRREEIDDYLIEDSIDEDVSQEESVGDQFTIQIS